MGSRLSPVSFRYAQLRQLRLRVVCLAVLCAEVIALVFLKAGFGLRLSLGVPVLFGLLLVFWPSMFGVAWLTGRTTSQFVRVSRRLLVRWRDSRFQFGLKTVFVLVTVCAVIAFVSKLIYDAAHPHVYMTGRVTFQGTNQPASGVLVRAQSIRRVTPQESYGFAETWTDRDGCYRLPMLPATKYNIWAEKEGWTCVAVDSFHPATNKLVKVPDVELVAGGWITGRVVNAKTGRPVVPIPAAQTGYYYPVLVETGGDVAAHVGLYGPSRPKSGAAIESAMIQDDGSFRIQAASGENLIYLMTLEGSWDFDLPNAMRVDVQEGLTTVVELKVMPTALP